MSIPRQGNDIIETGFPLLGPVSYDQSFCCPDALYPHSEATLQYQLATILETCGGRVYPEVQLSSGTDAIDLVWFDPANGRNVGIEVKRTGTVADASDQVAFYRDCTLGDMQSDDLIYDGSQTRRADDIHVLDAVWVATYAQPRPKYPSAPTNPNILDLVPEADGQLCFHSHSGRLYYDITEPSERETLPSRQYERTDDLRESEATLVGNLWRGLTAEGYTVSAEAPYTPDPSDRKVTEQLTYDSQKRADLVVSPNPDAWQESSPPVLKAIEVKSKKGINRGQLQKVIEQLRTYVSSALFSEVYLAVPCDTVPVEWLPGCRPSFGGFGGLDSLARIVDAIPEVGIISVHRSRNHSDAEWDACENEPFHIVDEEPGCPDTLTQRRIPTLRYTPDRDHRFEWAWYDEC